VEAAWASGLQQGRRWQQGLSAASWEADVAQHWMLRCCKLCGEGHAAAACMFK
jgi:hypothetical protein